MGSAWESLRRDRFAMLAGGFLVLLFVACFAGAPVAHRLLGHGPLQYFAYGTNDRQKPVPPWTWVPDQAGPYPPPTAHTPRTLFVLGADGPLGRDELLQLLYGGQTTLEIAGGATLFALAIALVIGTVGGFYGGVADALTSRATELVAAFPLLLFVIALGWTVAARLNGVTLGLLEPGVVSLVVVIGMFTWPYPARIIRSRVLALREQEFVEASRMLGARGPRIVRTHLLPHLGGTIAVYASLIVAANVVLEAALSMLNLGLQPDTPDWGSMLSQNYGTLLFRTQRTGQGLDIPTQQSVWTQVVPAVALLLTVVAFAVLGEGIRRAVDRRDAP
ncbi:MAG TPA: ABC transporter permease [Gaiellaceae bacterium]|nr:ABC transporter permease [Gaiellaceae bacterium]